MNLRDLGYAVCLAAQGQFRRAAERCHVSQPTLSAQIAKLEDELGLQLFERRPRAVTPTVNGRAVIRQAQIVLDEVERLKALARAGQDPLQGPFHLGAIPTAGPYLLPRLLPVLKKRWPQLRLLLREEQTRRSSIGCARARSMPRSCRCRSTATICAGRGYSKSRSWWPCRAIIGSPPRSGSRRAR
jgi:LysR family transcriptional regulator, hydrogen peroxide-inducible genes activator